MIIELLARELILEDFRAATPTEALEKLAGHAARNVDGVDGAELLRTLSQREAQASTALGDGVAIPHARIPGLRRMIVVFARSKRGIGWGAPDGRPVHLVLMLAGPAEDPGVYLRTLATISRVMRDTQCRARLMSAETPDDLLRILRDEVAKTAVKA